MGGLRVVRVLYAGIVAYYFSQAVLSREMCFEDVTPIACGYRMRILTTAIILSAGGYGERCGLKTVWILFAGIVCGYCRLLLPAGGEVERGDLQTVRVLDAGIASYIFIHRWLS